MRLLTAALGLLLLIQTPTASAQGAPATRPDAVTICEDRGGVGWSSLAADLLSAVQTQLAANDRLQAGVAVTPPLTVTGVRLVQQPDRAPRLCATFTEDRSRPRPQPSSITLSASDAQTYCRPSAAGSWETGLGRVLQDLANGEMRLTLKRPETVWRGDPSRSEFREAMGSVGEQVLVSGRYVRNVELVPDGNDPPSVCVTFAN